MRRSLTRPNARVNARAKPCLRPPARRPSGALGKTPYTAFRPRVFRKDFQGNSNLPYSAKRPRPGTSASSPIPNPPRFAGRNKTLDPTPSECYPRCRGCRPEHMGRHPFWFSEGPTAPTAVQQQFRVIVGKTRGLFPPLFNPLAERPTAPTANPSRVRARTHFQTRDNIFSVLLTTLKILSSRITPPLLLLVIVGNYR
jgi:hypothetical protein